MLQTLPVHAAVKRGHHKSCFVSFCTNTNYKCPTKHFFYVPEKASVRSKWLEVAGREPNYTSKCYCCEDHFKIEEDTRNWIHFKLMGGRLLLKEGVVPHIFHHRLKVEHANLTKIKSKDRKSKVNCKSSSSVKKKTGLKLKEEHKSDDKNSKSLILLPTRKSRRKTNKCISNSKNSCQHSSTHKGNRKKNYNHSHIKHDSVHSAIDLPVDIVKEEPVEDPLSIPNTIIKTELLASSQKNTPEVNYEQLEDIYPYTEQCENSIKKEMTDLDFAPFIKTEIELKEQIFALDNDLQSENSMNYDENYLMGQMIDANRKPLNGKNVFINHLTTSGNTVEEENSIIALIPVVKDTVEEEEYSKNKKVSADANKTFVEEGYYFMGLQVIDVNKYSVEEENFLIKQEVLSEENAVRKENYFTDQQALFELNKNTSEFETYSTYQDSLFQTDKNRIENNSDFLEEVSGVSNNRVEERGNCSLEKHICVEINEGTVEVEDFAIKYNVTAEGNKNTVEEENHFMNPHVPFEVNKNTCKDDNCSTHQEFFIQLDAGHVENDNCLTEVSSVIKLDVSDLAKKLSSEINKNTTEIDNTIAGQVVHENFAEKLLGQVASCKEERFKNINKVFKKTEFDCREGICERIRDSTYDEAVQQRAKIKEA